MRCLLTLTVALLVAEPSARAHELRPAYLEINETNPETYDVTWTAPARGDQHGRGAPHVSFVDDAVILEQPAIETSGDTYTERWRVRRPGGLAGTPVMIDGLASPLSDALVHVSLLGVNSQSALLDVDNPLFVIAYAPTGWEVIGTSFRLGLKHILLGGDHLLFVLGLVLVANCLWMLVKAITAFTVAYSLTLAICVLAMVRVPNNLLSATIALGILLLGIEITRKGRGNTSFTIRHPWVIAFVFGLLHGFGFANGLPMPETRVPEISSALPSFNLGIEAGLLAFVLVGLSVRWALRTLELHLPLWAMRVTGYAFVSLGAFWTLQGTLPILERLSFRP